MPGANAVNTLSNNSINNQLNTWRNELTFRSKLAIWAVSKALVYIWRGNV